MKLDTTLKRLGAALRRRLNDDLTEDTPPRIVELMERLHRTGQNARTNRNCDSAPSAR